MDRASFLSFLLRSPCNGVYLIRIKEFIYEKRSTVGTITTRNLCLYLKDQSIVHSVSRTAIVCYHRIRQKQCMLCHMLINIIYFRENKKWDPVEICLGYESL
jgi:hypothetical protein